MARTLASALIAASACCMVAGSRGARRGDGVVVSDFLRSADGWTAAGPHAAQVELLHAPMLVEGRDSGELSWFFSAPAKFLGDQSQMYGGALALRVGFWEHAGHFRNGSAASPEFDVVLSSGAAGLSLGRASLVLPLAFVNTLQVTLREDGGWEVVGRAPGTAPSAEEFQRVLGSLSQVQRCVVMCVRAHTTHAQTHTTHALQQGAHSCKCRCHRCGCEAGTTQGRKRPTSWP
ncbi:MAG: laminin B domain-containing protein [Promethearchaeia archaeon]